MDADGAGSPRISVEVYSDIVCPWCYIGKHRFERAVATLAADPEFPAGFEVVYRPFQLDPDAPRGRSEPVIDAYARKFGGPERAAQLIEHVTSIAAADGLEFRLDRARRANTADAHRLLWWTLSHHGATIQVLVKESLMAAYFTDGLDIGDQSVLADRAAACGVDREAAAAFLAGEEGVEALAVGLDRASWRDVSAVPTYVIDDQWSVPGAQDPEVFVNAFRRLVARRAGAA